MKPVVIGITGNKKEEPARSGLYFDTVSRNLSDGIRAAGGLPVIIPFGGLDLVKPYVDMIDKLILSGGQHVEPRFYGEKRKIDSNDYCLERDKFELALVKETLRQRKPVFAVCRGMQLLNVALGGTLNQQVDNHRQANFLGLCHKVEILPHSRISHLLDSGIWVNSIHHQSVKDLAPSLIVTAFDPRDGTIEAYESRSGIPILGIQWHPELLLKENQDSQRLLDYVVQLL